MTREQIITKSETSTKNKNKIPNEDKRKPLGRTIELRCCGISSAIKNYILISLRTFAQHLLIYQE